MIVQLLEPCLSHGSVLGISQLIVFSHLLLRHVVTRLHSAFLLRNNDVESVEVEQPVVPTTQSFNRRLHLGRG